jgi:hypothetical protein
MATNGLPRQVAPDPPVVLVESDGVVLALLGVEVWRHRVYVRLCCAENERTRQLEQPYTDALRAWTALEAEEAPRRPENPGSRVFDSASVSLGDDVGTLYEFIGGSGPAWNGVTGLEWAVSRSFAPAPPEDATQLDVTVTLSSDKAHTVTCRLE